VSDPDEPAVLLKLHEWGIPLSLDETAIALGMSREWARVLQKSALRKLREAMQQWAP
jgi:DNA-directed RNA polymerase sigma subunit (sigma70/sigma32)